MKLSKQLNERFAAFFEQHNARELSAGLRRMLLEYICERSKVGVDSKLEELIGGLNDLMDLLEMAEDRSCEEGVESMKPEASTGKTFHEHRKTFPGNHA